jgi:phosphoribosyl 1,2-cyclic phosphodiesterase
MRVTRARHLPAGDLRLTFLGTRGNIQVSSRRHRRHSALIVEGGAGRVLIDGGEDWLGRIARLHPVAILVSHAHDDHAGGLRHGAPCGVYASAEAWGAMARWPLSIRYVVPPRRAFALAGLIVEAWPVEHSILAPAVGYRVTAGATRLFYVPDVASIPDARAALREVDVYIGDGATLDRPLVRQRGAVRIGHATIGTQLDWCATAGVKEAIFTHCGSGIVRSDPRSAAVRVKAVARDRGVRARLAYDGLALTLGATRSV